MAGSLPTKTEAEVAADRAAILLECNAHVAAVVNEIVGARDGDSLDLEDLADNVLNLAQTLHKVTLMLWSDEMDRAKAKPTLFPFKGGDC